MEKRDRGRPHNAADLVCFDALYKALDKMGLFVEAGRHRAVQAGVPLRRAAFLRRADARQAMLFNVCM